MGGELQYCTFYVGGQHFGLEVLEVQEILHYQEMTRVPLAPPVVRGLINLRGQIVAAMDLRRRLGMPDRPADARPINVVVTTEDGALSLLADRIGDVLTVPEAAFERPPETLKGSYRDLILGTYKLAQGLLLILDIHKLITPDVGGMGHNGRALPHYPSRGAGALEHFS